MRIAVNTRFLLPNKLEGIGWFSYEVLKRWVAWHPEHEFIFIFDRKHDERFIFDKNVTPIVAFPPARHPFLFYLWFEWALPSVFAKQKADVFMSPDGFLSLRSKIPNSAPRCGRCGGGRKGLAGGAGGSGCCGRCRESCSSM